MVERQMRNLSHGCIFMSKKTITSIKSYPIRFHKKGKTRGRPSKGELWASEILSRVMENNGVKKALDTHLQNLMIHGQSDFKIVEQAIDEYLKEN